MDTSPILLWRFPQHLWNKVVCWVCWIISQLFPRIEDFSGAKGTLWVRQTAGGIKKVEKIITYVPWEHDLRSAQVWKTSNEPWSQVQMELCESDKQVALTTSWGRVIGPRSSVRNRSGRKILKRIRVSRYENPNLQSSDSDSQWNLPNTVNTDMRRNLTS